MSGPISYDARLAAIEARIASACQAADRPREGLTLVAVSKEQPDEAVRAFHALGVRDFGENKVQALAARAERLADLSDIRWHLIGPVQTNKAKDIARLPLALLHTIDRPELVVALDKRLTTTLSVLIQVDIDREAQKAGVLPEALAALVDQVLASTHLSLRGVMAIPRPREDVGDAALARSFAAMRTLGDTLTDRLGNSLIVSMGMSDDFELAIAAGSTHIRVGSALFGPRTYSILNSV